MNFRWQNGIMCNLLISRDAIDGKESHLARESRKNIQYLFRAALLSNKGSRVYFLKLPLILKFRCTSLR
jgi:hypothetical protein